MKKPPKPPAQNPDQAPPALAEYAKKRDFSVTREPAPDKALPPADELADAPPTFMVHKHDARRLHYDLRLEIGGALASWAVPNGPCFDPGEKRLAVQTEDHPLAYASFEGRIPDGEYGAGDALVWDRGIYETVPPGRAAFMRDKGHLDILLLGEKLKGRWHLVRTGGQRARAGGRPQWLLMKARDEYANDDYDVVTERPESVVSGRSLTRGPTPAAKKKTAIATDPLKLLMQVGTWPPPAVEAGHGPPDESTDSPWLFLAHRGGERVFAAVAGGKVALQSAAGRDLAAAHPAVVTALRQLPVLEAVFEGELTGPKPRDARLWLSDLLLVDGRDLRPLPFAQRRDLLGAVALPAAAVALTEAFPGPFAAALEAARDAGLPGLVTHSGDDLSPPATPARLYPTKS